MAEPHRRPWRASFVAVAAAILSVVVPLSLPATAAADPGVPDRLDERGSAPDLGSPTPEPGRRLVGLAASPGGYRIAADDGAVYTYGGTTYLGGANTVPLSAPIVGIASTPAGDGYWLVAADGGVFTYGSAPFLGSLGGVPLVAPIVGIASTPAGDGYWLVAADGGVFTFGGAGFHGSIGGRRLNRPVMGMATTPSGGGYWLAASDGGVFTFGDAQFFGSLGGVRLSASIVGMAATPAGDGYWLVGGDGGVFTYGTAAFLGAAHASEPVTSITADGSSGYWVLHSPIGRNSGAPLPPNSGFGRRVVYDNGAQRVWLVEWGEQIVRTYPVSGKFGTPTPGVYSVYSKSLHAFAGHGGITMDNMVRFARGRTLAIGFHDIPRDRFGRPLQTEDDLGGYRSAGCVRQSDADAIFLWDWAPIGTTVVVL